VYKQPTPNTLDEAQSNTVRTWKNDRPWSKKMMGDKQGKKKDKK
jgi:hypothetical protein